jgi:hypothetical protein
MNCRNILCFDVHTRAQHKFARITQEFFNQGYNITLIHSGSLGHDKNTLNEYQFEFINVIDISCFGGNISSVLDKYKPDLAIFLSTRSVFQMAVISHCVKSNIPTIHCYHGLVSIQNFGNTYKSKTSIFLKKILIKIPKNILILYPFYIRNILSKGLEKKDFLGLYQLIKFQLGSDTFKYIENTSTDIGCIYTRDDFEDISIKYRIDSDNIVIGGNPDLSEYYSRELVQKDVLDYSENVGIYIDTCLYSANLIFGSIDDWINDLQNILEKLSLDKIYWKPHPANPREVVSEVSKRLEMTVVDSLQFSELLPRARLVVCESTTLIMAAAAHGKALVLLNHGFYSGMGYGDLILSYPRKVLSADYSERNMQSISKQDYSEWFTDKIGPNPNLVSQKLLNKYYEFTGKRI